MRRTLRRLFVGLLILAALVATLPINPAIRFTWLILPWREVLKSQRSRRELIAYLLLGPIVGIYGCYALRALRWQRFCRYLGPSSFWSTYSATFDGLCGNVHPGPGRGTGAAPGVDGAEKSPTVRRRDVRNLLSCERGIDFASAAVLACLSLLVFPKALSDAGADTSWVEGARSGAWLLLGGLLAVVAFLFYYRLHGAGAADRFLNRWRSESGMRRRLASVLTGISEGLQAIRTRSDLLLAMGYSAVHWAMAAGIYWAIARAFAADFVQSNMNFPGAMLLLTVTLVGSVLNLPGLRGRGAARQHHRPDQDLRRGTGASGRDRRDAVAHHVCGRERGWDSTTDS